MCLGTVTLFLVMVVFWKVSLLLWNFNGFVQLYLLVLFRTLVLCVLYFSLPQRPPYLDTHTDGNRNTVATLTMIRLSLALTAPARQGRVPFLQLLVCPWGTYKLKQKQRNKRLTKGKTITSFLSHPVFEKNVVTFPLLSELIFLSSEIFLKKIDLFPEYPQT